MDWCTRRTEPVAGARDTGGTVTRRQKAVGDRKRNKRGVGRPAT